MAVVKGNRQEGKLEVITKCRILCAYTIQVCRSEKIFPKKNRWLLTQKIVNEALESMTCLRIANSVRVQVRSDYDFRRAKQIEAYGHLEALLTLIDLAYEALSIETARIENWTKAVLETEGLLQRWRKADRGYYRDIIKLDDIPDE